METVAGVCIALNHWGKRKMAFGALN